eukprot:SAG31_NODE_6233_length_2108_cov_4.439522_3_plen_126_part_00
MTPQNFSGRYGPWCARIWMSFVPARSRPSEVAEGCTLAGAIKINAGEGPLLHIMHQGANFDTVAPLWRDDSIFAQDWRTPGALRWLLRPGLWLWPGRGDEGHCRVQQICAAPRMRANLLCSARTL